LLEGLVASVNISTIPSPLLVSFRMTSLASSALRVPISIEHHLLAALLAPLGQAGMGSRFVPVHDVEVGLCLSTM
jgi:hypothetical protein